MNRNYITLAKCATKIKTINSTENQFKKEELINELFELFVREKGLFLKLGQFLNQHKGKSNYTNRTTISITDLDSNTQELIEKTCNNHTYRLLDEEINLGSIGFVVKVEDENKETKCIKIQYPNIRKNIEKQFKALINLEKIAPKFIKQDSTLIDLLNGLENNIKKELNYKIEVENTKRYSQNLAFNSIKTVSPKLIEDDIIEMSYAPGINLNSSERFLNKQREIISDLLIDNFHNSLFNSGFIQVDNQEDNFLYDSVTGNLHILDLGNCIEVNLVTRASILRLIHSIQNKIDTDYIKLLGNIGFNEEKLRNIESLIPPLLEAILAPYSSDYKFDLENYNINKTVDNILGEHKWWFRAAGNDQVFSLMRSYSLILKTLSKLNTPIFFKKKLNDILEEEVINKSEQMNFKSNIDYFKEISRNLEIKITQNNIEKVHLILPANVLKNIDDYIDSEIKKSIEETKVDLNDTIRSAFLNNLRPMTILNLDHEDKHITIKLTR